MTIVSSDERLKEVVVLVKKYSLQVTPCSCPGLAKSLGSNKIETSFSGPSVSAAWIESVGDECTECEHHSYQSLNPVISFQEWYRTVSTRRTFELRMNAKTAESKNNVRTGMEKTRILKNGAL